MPIKVQSECLEDVSIDVRDKTVGRRMNNSGLTHLLEAYWCTSLLVFGVFIGRSLHVRVGATVKEGLNFRYSGNNLKAWKDMYMFIIL